jgi:hypothetical protein
MDLLRHWVVDRPGEAGTYEQITITDERNVVACRGAGWRVQGPYVPEAQLQGAVSDAEKLAAYARSTLVQQPHGELPSPDEVQAIIDRYPPKDR